MYEFKKDEVVYYFIKYKNLKTPGIVKLKSEKDQSSVYGIGFILRIEHIFTSTNVGNPNRIIVGHTISANELQGVGASGIGTYLYKPRELIINLFETSNLHK